MGNTGCFFLPYSALSDVRGKQKKVFPLLASSCSPPFGGFVQVDSVSHSEDDRVGLIISSNTFLNQN